MNQELNSTTMDEGMQKLVNMILEREDFREVFKKYVADMPKADFDKAVQDTISQAMHEAVNILLKASVKETSVQTLKDLTIKDDFKIV